MQEVSKLENAEEILKIPILYEERGKDAKKAVERDSMRDDKKVYNFIFLFIE